MLLRRLLPGRLLSRWLRSWRLVAGGVPPGSLPVLRLLRVRILW